MSLCVKGLKVSYDKKVIIENMDLELPEGKISMIIGKNGCGKSTFLKAACRLISRDAGDLILDGKSMASMNSKEIARKMAILPQSPIAPSGLTVKELVSYGRFPYQKAFGGLTSDDKETIEWAMKETNVFELCDDYVDELSGGQRQRVWIAMAIAQRTKTLILDEPTTYLDMAHQLEILQLLQKINRRNHTTIIMVLHELNQASKFADHIVGMKSGNVIFEGAPTDVITKENLEALYHIDASLQMSKNGKYPICIDYEIGKE